MPIDSVVLPLEGRKFAGAKIWNTTILNGVSGLEIRNANWDAPLHRFDLAPGIKTMADRQTLFAFHMACQGSYRGFLLKDYTDFVATVNVDGSANNLGGGVYQLTKWYTNGVTTYIRRITRPKAGTVALYQADGVTQIISGYSIDYTTGKVTSVTPVAGWTGHFYVPCRFESDEISFDLARYNAAEDRGYGEMPEIGVVEIRE